MHAGRMPLRRRPSLRRPSPRRASALDGTSISHAPANGTFFVPIKLRSRRFAERDLFKFPVLEINWNVESRARLHQLCLLHDCRRRISRGNVPLELNCIPHRGNVNFKPLRNGFH
jgi:hypothetical protein